MVAGISTAQTSSLAARGPARSPTGVEAAFRDALLASFDALELCDRNLLRFHYFHGVAVEQLADMFSTPRATVARRLARIRERLLRDTRRGLALRLELDGHGLDRLLEVARERFDLAIARSLRSSRR